MVELLRHPLVLFDIDGTLITSGGAGTRSMNMAFEKLFGVDNAFDNISMAGKTDIQIMKEGLLTHGLDVNHGNLENMQHTYISFLRQEINNPLKKTHPGVIKALDLLRNSNVAIGLLTGNLVEGAQIKLGACGIYDYFIDGAFGSDHEDRNQLLPIAIEKFSGKGMSITPSDCIVVGDTPRDVECAKIYGATCVAVATGPYAIEVLRKTEADMVVETLEEETFCKFIDTFL